MNKKEYKSALKEIESIWDAAPGTSKFERFEELVKLIEEYELQNFPISPPTAKEADDFRKDQMKE